MILHYIYNNKKRAMNYIEYNEDYYFITKPYMDKVAFLKEDSTVKLVIQHKEVFGQAILVEDKSEVKQIYDRFEAMKNNFYDKYTDDLVVIKVVKK